MAQSPDLLVLDDDRRGDTGGLSGGQFGGDVHTENGGARVSEHICKNCDEKNKQKDFCSMTCYIDFLKKKVDLASEVVNNYDRLRAQNEELVKAINEAISKVDDAPFEWIRLNQDYLKPIVRPLKQALKSAEAK